MSATAAGCGSSVGMNFGKEYYKMIVNAGYRGKVGAAAPKFTYTGQYNIRKDGVVELLTSGTITFLSPAVIDIFCVGGGGKGGVARYTASDAGGGGGGGFTRTVRRINVSGAYNIAVGAGATALRTPGGTSSFGSVVSAAGGNSGGIDSAISERNGLSGGSGGGGGAQSNSSGGIGGSDGGSGGSATGSGGAGQGTTTREFGEAGGKLYAGGGGGGRYFVSASPVVSMGGAGGGGSGGWAGSASQGEQAPAAGIANTGGGGGGGVDASGHTLIQGASGGSGIVCFRDAAPLPELAGTWVLNERLYAPESAFTENVNFNAAETATGTQRGFTGVKNNTINGQLIFFNSFTDDTIYYYSSNTWGANNLKYLTFPAGATASDEFRAWLASNATKQ